MRSQKQVQAADVLKSGGWGVDFSSASGPLSQFASKVNRNPPTGRRSAARVSEERWAERGRLGGFAAQELKGPGIPTQYRALVTGSRGASSGAGTRMRAQ